VALMIGLVALVGELPTLAQAEDAAANALGQLIGQGIEDRMAEPGTPLSVAARETARELLRGPLAEDYSRRPGGYCMRAPTDPVLRAIAHVGARMVELSYTVRDPVRALAEAARLFDGLGRYSPVDSAGPAAGSAGVNPGPAAGNAEAPAGATAGTPDGNAGAAGTPAGKARSTAGPTDGNAGAAAGTPAGKARSTAGPTDGMPAVGAGPAAVGAGR
jgi:hypothetical protein